MKCKVFKIHLHNESDETEFNQFLSGVRLKQTFAEVVNDVENYWSVMVFYEETGSSAKSEKLPSFSQSPPTPGQAFSVSPAAAISEIPPAPPAEMFTPQQEKSFEALKNWRNERARLEGLPPYVVAHDELLMQIVGAPIKTPQDLMKIKDFGYKRAEIYGEEIVKILSANA